MIISIPIDKTRCLIGGPGNGKAYMAEAIAKSEGRPYSFVNIGTINDPSILEGSLNSCEPGLFAKILHDSKCSNPVIILENVDSIHPSILQVLFEATHKDSSSKFYDVYLDTYIDLSKVMFICTASSVTPDITKYFSNAWYIIHLKSLSLDEKLDIAKKTMIPKLLKSVKLQKGVAGLTNSIIKKIIAQAPYDSLESIQNQLEIYVNMSLRSKETKDVKRFQQFNEKIKSIKTHTQLPEGDVGFCCGVGSQLWPIEVTSYPSNGKIDTLTIVGPSTTEAVIIADILLTIFQQTKQFYGDKVVRSYVVSVPSDSQFKISQNMLPIFVSLFSSYLDYKLSDKWAYVGELTLNGNLYGLTSLDSIVHTAKEGKVTQLIIPKCNEDDWKCLPEKMGHGDIQPHFVESVYHLISVVFELEPSNLN